MRRILSILSVLAVLLATAPTMTITIAEPGSDGTLLAARMTPVQVEVGFVDPSEAAPPYIEDCCIEDGWILCCWLAEWMDDIGWE